MNIEISTSNSELDYQFQLSKKLEALWYYCKQNCTIFVSHIQDDKYEYYKNKSINKQTRTKYIVDILATKWYKKFIVEMKKDRKSPKTIQSRIERNRNMIKRVHDDAQVEKYKKTWLPVFLCYWTSGFTEILDYARNSSPQIVKQKYRLVAKWKVLKR